MQTIQPQEKSFIALTFRDGQAGHRKIYFVDRIRPGDLSGATMLLGELVSTFETEPSTLRMVPGGTNRIYFPGDKRVSAYEPLTEEETEDTRRRLLTLSEAQLEYTSAIQSLIQRL